VTRSPKPAQTVACPSCGKAIAYTSDNKWRPFCCERCRLTDLGSWASESYRIPAKPAEDEGAGGADDSET
jgi:endogenous inhibitor of DNA gyrase (YacG/DUF329 family)